MENLNVKFEVPTTVISQAGLDLKNISQEVKRILAIFLYEHKRISLSKACEIGGMSQWEFSDMNCNLGIPTHYSEDNLSEDLEKLSDV